MIKTSLEKKTGTGISDYFQYFHTDK